MSLGVVLGILAYLVITIWGGLAQRRVRLLALAEAQKAHQKPDPEPVTAKLPTEAASILEADPEIDWTAAFLDDGEVGFMNPLTGEIVVPGTAV
jgi:hypothetical protein